MKETMNASRPEPTYYTPTLVLHLADGSTLLKPGKPVLRATAAQTAKWTGISRKNLRVLAEIGLLRVAQSTPHTFLYYPAEVEAFICRTEADPDFWNRVRREAYIRARRLRDSKVEDRKTEDRREEQA